MDWWKTKGVFAAVNWELKWLKWEPAIDPHLHTAKGLIRWVILMNPTKSEEQEQTMTCYKCDIMLTRTSDSSLSIIPYPELVFVVRGRVSWPNCTHIENPRSQKKTNGPCWNGTHFIDGVHVGCYKSMDSKNSVMVKVPNQTYDCRPTYSGQKYIY